MHYDIAKIEREARQLRADATRAGMRAMGRWIAARFAALTQGRAKAQHS